MNTNLGSVINDFLRRRIIETNCVLENTPPPLFGLDVVYKIGGRINGTLRYIRIQFALLEIACKPFLLHGLGKRLGGGGGGVEVTVTYMIPASVN